MQNNNNKNPMINGNSHIQRFPWSGLNALSHFIKILIIYLFHLFDTEREHKQGEQ